MTATEPRRGPIAPHQPGCCGYAGGPLYKSATHCVLEPVWAGTVSFASGDRYGAFACEGHRDLLERPVRLEPDRAPAAELARRRQLWGLPSPEGAAPRRSARLRQPGREDGPGL